MQKKFISKVNCWYDKIAPKMCPPVWAESCSKLRGKFEISRDQLCCTFACQITFMLMAALFQSILLVNAKCCRRTSLFPAHLCL